MKTNPCKKRVKKNWSAIKAGNARRKQISKCGEVKIFNADGHLQYIVPVKEFIKNRGFKIIPENR